MDSKSNLSAKVNILIINGPNLNLLGKRDPNHYGSTTLAEIEEALVTEFAHSTLSFFQSNIEGEIVEALQGADEKNLDGIILNAGGYTHTSVAIRDAIDAIATPVVEVHLSNTAAREDFRQTSLIAPVCVGSIAGFGKWSYSLAVQALNLIANR